ncbi:barstar family protein [Helcococcus massiliensis]|uniref:barstar family protein n=1 Tax=Helcococcus massiliensis TaxID=2040290 RepID=UPI000CDE58FF|nr:barstar family protein [Helcococcus massiliensis]
MNKIILDGRDYTSKEAFHKDMKKKFNFPDFYGENLDALWDLLSEKNALNIEIKHSSDLIKNLGDYGKQIIDLFTDLREEGFTVTFDEDEFVTIKEINGIRPSIPTSAYIAEGARVIGNVVLGENVSVWYNAVIRGDLKNKIVIGDNSNVQDNAVIHLSRDSEVSIGKNVTIGHSAIIHGATIEDNVLIGMGSIILDGAHIKKNTIIGAATLVTKNKVIEEGSMVMGTPGKVVRQCSQEEIESITENANSYINNIIRHK